MGHQPAGLSALVLQSQAIFTMMFAVALLRERPSARQVVGLAIAAGGIALVASRAGSGGTGTPRAFALVLGAGAAWGLANIAMRGAGGGARLRHRPAPAALTERAASTSAGGWAAVRFMVWVSAVAAPIDLALSLLIEGPRRDLAALSAIGPVAGFAIGYVAWVATLLGFGFWGGLLRRYGAARVAPFAMLAPVCAIGAGALLLRQPVHPVDVAGGVIVVAGILTGLLPARARPAPVRVLPARLPRSVMSATLKANRSDE
ncbi:MAG TPA: EamA family transporter [Rugosimonospora sp.]|nr:EamA family transporter [Rugosimonospora sp.]